MEKLHICFMVIKEMMKIKKYVLKLKKLIISKVNSILIKIIDLLNTIKKDKLLHFFVGSIILFLSLLFFNTFISVSIVFIIAIAKEVIYDDFLEKGNSEMEDFFYTILPCLFQLINANV